MRRGLTFVPPVLIAVLLAIAAVPLVGGAIAFASITADLPAPQDLAKDPLALATHVYDRTGKDLLYTFAEQQREPVTIDEVPQTMIDATVAAENKTFWTDPGVDIGGIVRAAFADLTGRTSGQGGASTITQQLVKQRIVGDEYSLTRKIREAILAIEVTRTYSKRQILQLYFNQIYYGDQAYGIRAAAQTYFGVTDLHKLTVAQCALLAGLPQAPSGLDPSKPENVARAKERRAYVLSQMEDMGSITAQQEALAEAEPIKVNGPQIATITAPHFVFQVRDQLTRILGGDEGAVMRGGYKVITTLDMNKQKAAEDQVKTWVGKLKDHNVWNAALVSIDPKTGEVLSYVGSVDYYDRTDPRVQGQYDAAGIGLRQPGSAFKVFNYLTALEKGATEATVVVDAKTDFTGKAPATGPLNPATCGWCPDNADGRFDGPITMRQAILESRNVPAVKFLQEYSGIADTIKTAQAMGITTPMDPSTVGLSLTLGTQVVKLVDMTSAFGVIDNGGVRVDPTYILKVEDPTGKVVWEHKDYAQKRVLDPGVAFVMNDILRDYTNPNTDFEFGSWTNIGRPAALKTGTTDDLKDVYSVGYTPQVVTGVWMGNSNNEPMSGRDFLAAMGPGQLWRDYMKQILTGVPVENWTPPSDVVRESVVVAPGAYGGYGSGMLPSKLSPFATPEWFVKGTEPRTVDDWYVPGCPKPDGTTTVGMRIQEVGPALWKPYTDRWIAEAQKGLHSYGRFAWNLVGEGACPSPSPTPTPTPSGSAHPSGSPGASPSGPGSSSTPIPTIQISLPPGVTWPPGLTPTPRPTPKP
ncbi:MAG: transglycosylase domain-containing protein [Chloroflexota bacterium]|nr:transglycosylase domain-containing protein [Chloroflexota bacterium]